jgi:hypothetical protein
VFKLGDVGLSRFLPESSSVSQFQSQGNLTYAPAEVAERNVYGPSSDVFCLALASDCGDYRHSRC